MTEFTRGRPYLGLLGLVTLNLLLLSIQIRSEDGRLLLRSWGLAALSPLALAAQSGLEWFGSLASGFRYLGRLEDRNRYLEEQNWRLQTRLHSLEALRRQVERDQSFQLLAEAFQFETLRAAVVWRNVPLFSERIIINAGRVDGVRKDSAVIRPEGVVGRVFVATGHISEVELLIDVNAAAAATLDQSGLHGIVQGSGERNLRLSYIRVTEPVADGELVVTSGLDGIYPKGIPIGTVISCRPGVGIFHEIEVEPFVNFQRLETVAVVLGSP